MASMRPYVKGHLHAGMPVAELVSLGAGCTSGQWVCPRLLKVRKRYSE